jgi:hypothetical protein
MRLVLNNTAIILINNGAIVATSPLSSTTAINITGGNNATNTLAVDFSNGNMIPSGSAGLTFIGGGIVSTDTLNLENQLPSGPWNSEVDNPTPPQVGGGTITFNGSTTINYAGLQPIIDTTPAKFFTLNDPNASDSINVINDPNGIENGNIANEINSSTPTFEKVDFANKANVAVTASSGSNTLNLNVSVPAIGLSTLTLVGGHDL